MRPMFDSGGRVRPFATVIIATCGSDQWQGYGDQAALTVPAGVPIVRVHEPYGTVAGTRNAGIAQVETEYLCWLDADDSLTPDYFEIMETGSADIRQPNIPGWNAGRETPPQCVHHGPAHDGRRECLAYGNPFSAGALVRTELAQKHLFSERWQVLEDFAFWRTVCADPTVTVECLPATYLARTREPRQSRNRSIHRGLWRQIAFDIMLSVPFPEEP